MNLLKVKMFSFVLLICMLFSFIKIFANCTDVIQVYINNHTIQLEQSPVMLNDRTMVPLRSVFEALGCDVFWNDEFQVIIIAKNETKIIMRIGSCDFKKCVGSDFVRFKLGLYPLEDLSFESPPQVIKGTAYVPIRVVCEAIGVNVVWDDPSQVVMLTCPKDFISDVNSDKDFAQDYFAYLKEIENGLDFAEAEEYKGEYYFPKETGISDFKNNWYSGQLFALKEPIIFTQFDTAYKSVYRFTCLRTFSPPYSIRIVIDEQEKTGTIYFKMCDGAGGYAPGKLVVNEEKPLNNPQIDELLKTFDKHNYWNMPFQDDYRGSDGTEWVFEMLKDGKYHAIDRWCTKEGSVYDLGKLFIKLTGYNLGV